ncbi:arginyltransferase [Novipirellula artificiosorum]|uniref:Arginyl-tRNA-protein transferase n=1 Tax=Novipirellula artificiosorum TaxID=2528016 RepID=A0A5C6DC89_9BACT|nr:arginyltransferase [Novipirellula artificiosorum]TWU33387.1 arginyl-tRNA-protein transferase [Novipirellula artificiosorum]
MSRPTEFRLPNDECRLVVIQDQTQPCPYREGVVARMPLRLPIGNVTPEIMDKMLAMGFRRSGDFVYRTECPECRECQPTRVKVAEFEWTRSLRRVLKRGDRDLNCRWGHPSVDSNRVEMFNDHRQVRSLGGFDEPVDQDGYRAFLCNTCCDTRELAIYRGEKLVALSIVDVGRESTSAVYTHFRPEESVYSLGTYAVLKQIQWANETDRPFVYLGMFVAENRHLNYKARYRHQQRFVAEQWGDVGD